LLTGLLDNSLMSTMMMIIRYTPFWAVPLAIISFEFAYIFWMKAYRRITYVLFFTGSISIIAIAYYFWMGGPDNATQHFYQLTR